MKINYRSVFTLAQDKGWKIHHKRVLGNPLYTTKETQLQDALLELTLIQRWLREKHKIGVAASQFPVYNDKYGFQYGRSSISSGWSPDFENGDTYEGTLLTGIYNGLNLIK